jgi:uncharacterized protein (UPF0276 family)
VSGAPHCPLPPRGGIGLKPSHYAEVLEAAERGAGLHWAEVHPQNYMMDGGPAHRWLTAIREAMPIGFHSIGLSLGDPSGCDRDELNRLAALVDRYEPSSVSDHLSWSSIDGERFPDLLPMPMTRSSLDHFAGEVGRVQDRLKRSMLVENPSRMLAFAADEFDEPSFIAELCARSGCGLLLDINNVIVSGINIGVDSITYLNAIDPKLVGEIHVAGHSIELNRDGTQIAIDDHGSAVSETCWDLLARFIRRAGPRPVLVERDNDIPCFAELAAEVARADDMLRQELADAA